MIFEQNTAAERIGMRAGYLFAYLLFTSILFIVLTVFNKIPIGWSYFHVMGATFVIVIFGIGIKRFLK